MTVSPEFYSDRDVSRLLGMSPSWVRGERFKRRHRLPHLFDVEPYYLGTSPRYLRGDVEAFIERLKAPYAVVKGKSHA